MHRIIFCFPKPFPFIGWSEGTKICFLSPFLNLFLTKIAFMFGHVWFGEAVICPTTWPPRPPFQKCCLIFDLYYSFDYLCAFTLFPCVLGFTLGLLRLRFLYPGNNLARVAPPFCQFTYFFFQSRAICPPRCWIEFVKRAIFIQAFLVRVYEKPLTIRTLELDRIFQLFNLCFEFSL